MRVLQRKYTPAGGWEDKPDSAQHPERIDLVLAFGSRQIIANTLIFDHIRTEFANAQILSCSTAGEIYHEQVNDDSLSLIAVQFEKTTLTTAITAIEEHADSYQAAKHLALAINHSQLKHVLVLADGQQINGSDLVLGLRENLPKEVLITGGLAGDGARFSKTLVGLNQAPAEGKIVVLGFYGDIVVTCGSFGGWNPFGPERLVTKSVKNILFELDDRPALDIYKEYLGEYAGELPNSGLMFPLSIRAQNDTVSLVRTILSVNEQDKSLTFAGNIDKGMYARLMIANPDKLIDGASRAAQNSLNNHLHSPDLAILISCVGRKLVLNQRVEEEVEVIRSVYGSNTAITGFYSYGEISTAGSSTHSELHNQTMTITTLTELN